jgi:hypothetical protein
MLPVEFTIIGPPISQRARGRSLRKAVWQAAVRAAAVAAWPAGAPPVEEGVSVEITHFFEGAPADTDNVPKPILDALTTLLFKDDRQVTDLISRRRPLGGPFSVEPMSKVIADALASGREFVHVRIASSPEGGSLRFL